MLDQWAKDWGVSPLALQDLRKRMGVFPSAPVTNKRGAPGSEDYTQSLTKLSLAKQGATMFRNNVGGLQDSTGRTVRYGLANDSKELNEQFKSSDLIGLRPVLITPAWLGHTIGQFVAVECKKGDWQPGEDKAREGAQERFGKLIIANGGHFEFSKGDPQLPVL